MIKLKYIKIKLLVSFVLLILFLFLKKKKKRESIRIKYLETRWVASMLPIPNLTQTKNKKVSEVSLTTVQNSNSSPYLSNLQSPISLLSCKETKISKTTQNKAKDTAFCDNYGNHVLL